jgi:hypothetical protein
MNKETEQAITRHGESLLAAFPDAIEKDPIKLFKLLRRVEGRAAKIGLYLCNGPDMGEEWTEKETEVCLAKVRKILGISREKAEEIGLFVNRDPRGYALKVGEAWTRGYNCAAKEPLHPDWGGFGILAPDLNR